MKISPLVLFLATAAASLVLAAPRGTAAATDATSSPNAAVTQASNSQGGDASKYHGGGWNRYSPKYCFRKCDFDNRHDNWKDKRAGSEGAEVQKREDDLAEDSDDLLEDDDGFNSGLKKRGYDSGDSKDRYRKQRKHRDDDYDSEHDYGWRKCRKYRQDKDRYKHDNDGDKSKK
ncbi:hypothetical protein JCM11251_005791 [Rhodosporidiobolus azoricus]